MWIISRLNGVIEIVTKSLESYDAFTASHAIKGFVQDLSLWYVRRSRDRIGPSAQDSEDKNACYHTLHTVLVTLSQILAPFIPFISEEIYTNLTGEESIHLSNWPEVQNEAIDPKLEEEMIKARNIVELIHAARKEKIMKVRQPLSLVTYGSTTQLSKDVEQLIADETNIKEIRYEGYKDKTKIVDVSVDFTLTPELKDEGEARELIRKIQIMRKVAGCALDQSIRVELPTWPKAFEEQIKRETLTTELICGKNSRILMD